MQTNKQKKLYIFGFFLIVLSLFLLDNMTKMLAQKEFLITSSPTDVHEYFSNSLSIFLLESGKNWFNFSLTYVRNTGAAWGFLGNMNENIRPYFFNIVTAIAMVLIIYFMLQIPRTKQLARFGMIFIFAGACGNFYDRFVFHYVVDWLHVRWNIFSWYYDFPVFNIADSCVTIGVSLLLIDMIATEFRRKKHGPTTVPKKLDK